MTHSDLIAHVDSTKAIDVHRGGHPNRRPEMVSVVRACDYGAPGPRLLSARDGHAHAGKGTQAAHWQQKQTYSGPLARTNRVHQVEKPRVRPSAVRISDQSDLLGIDALRGPFRILRFPL